MKSGLEDRNNLGVAFDHGLLHRVSMKSGLEDRNNLYHQFIKYIHR